MPRTNPNIIAGSCVSPKMHYLRKTAFAFAVLAVDTNVPGTSFEGNVMGVYMDSDVNYHNVTFDVLPDIVIPLRVTCLRYKNNTPRRRRQVQQQQQPTVTGKEYPDLLEDTIQATSPTESESEIDVETVDLNWKDCSISIDQRLASPDTSYHYINPSLIDLSGAFATPA
jgi:hypothetical protein